MTNDDIKLKVMEAVQDDVNKGIVRLDSNFMKQIGINEGDVVEIKGEKTTAAIVRRGYPGDINLSIVRIDGDTRKNAKTSIGEFVNLKKAEVVPAKRIVVGPLGRIPPLSHEFLKTALLNRPIMKNDIISLRRDRQKVIRQAGLVIQVQENFMGFGAVKLFVAETNPAKDIVTINEDTELVFDPRASFKEKEETLTLAVNYEDIGGLGEEIKKVREMIELPLKHPEIFERLGIEPPKGVLLHGPPGTGKTLLAKAVASETQSHFILINGPEVMSKFYGESEANLRKKFEEAEQNAPSIIFLDEIDAIATKREETKGDVEKRVVAQLLGLMDGLKSRGKVIVIAATNMPNVVDPALRRPGRFDREIEIGVPDKNGRLDILKIHTRNMPMNKTVKLEDIAKVTHGFVGADLNALAKEAAMIVLRRILPDLKKAGIEEGQTIPEDILKKLMVTQKDFIESLKIVRPSAMREVLVETPDVNWEDVGGLDDVKGKLKEAVEWPLKQPEVFLKMGIRPPRGVLLYGPPGTGKTLLAKAVAKESEANFILVNGPSLLSKWVGESEKAVREIFRKARQTSPTILFFDEIDALVPRRGRGNGEGSQTTEKMVNQVLTEMDGLESLNDVLVIGATNRPDIIDPALLRQGRFDRVIFTPVADEEGRKKIFEIYLKGMPLFEDIDVNKLASKTKGYVGADIEGVCREAGMIALREDMNAEKVKMEHFIKALEVVKPSVNKEIEETYKQLEDYFSVARANQIKQEKADYFG
jgi:transitional endoplasmic reticulum ATPase